MDFYFEDFVPGRVFHSAWFVVEESQIIEFGEMYDPQPIHTDREAAGKSMFKGLIASGFQTAALCIKLAIETGVFRASSLAGTGIDELRWLHPLRPGAKVRLEFAVIGRELGVSGTKGKVTFAYRLFDETDDLLTMKLTKLIRCDPVEAATESDTPVEMKKVNHEA